MAEKEAEQKIVKNPDDPNEKNINYKQKFKNQKLNNKIIWPFITLALGIVFAITAIVITILTFALPIIGQILGISLLSTFFAAAVASITPSAIKIINNKSEKSSVKNSEHEMSTENSNERSSLFNKTENKNFSNEEEIPQLGDSETKSKTQKENGEP